MLLEAMELVCIRRDPFASSFDVLLLAAFAVNHSSCVCLSITETERKKRICIPKALIKPVGYTRDSRLGNWISAKFMRNTKFANKGHESNWFLSLQVLLLSK